MADLPIFASSRGEVALSRIGDLNLFVAAERISDSEWLEWLEFGPRTIAEHGQAPISINYSTGSGPNAKQRALLADKADALRLNDVGHQVILTDSVLLRGAITAMSWVIGGPTESKAMGTRHLGEAFAWLGQYGKFDPQRALARLNELGQGAGLPPLSL